ncbi:MAG: hypothetical protein AAF152_15030 [Cyanobacteria bacterium P01_A01_bin.114]
MTRSAGLFTVAIDTINRIGNTPFKHVFSLTRRLLAPTLLLGTLSLSPISISLDGAIVHNTAQAQSISDQEDSSFRQLIRQGMEFGQTNQLEEAFDSYLQALDLAREADDLKAEGEVFFHLGVTHIGIGYYQEALDYLKIAEEKLRVTAPDSLMYQMTFLMAAQAFEELGEVETAEQLRERARELSDQ